MSQTFSTIPVLDYAQVSDPNLKPHFLSSLRNALINVGFLYLSNAPVAQVDIDKVVEYLPKLFDIPQPAKEDLHMSNSAAFLGYSRLGDEMTKGKQDYREQFDFGTPYEAKWKTGDPEYYKTWGPSQWPREDLLPGFKETYERYLAQLTQLTFEFTDLVSEALSLPKEALRVFYPSPISEHLMHRSKVVKYPVPSDPSIAQGVGPHYDGGFLTLLLQGSPHKGLQVQNLLGEWIDAPPILGTFVINFGKALEFVTQGLVRATSHRVLSPTGPSPRYSVPFFQNCLQDVRLVDSVIEFTPEILKLKEERGELVPTDSVNFTEFHLEPFGQVQLIGRIKSHPETGKIHYPELFQKLFPEETLVQSSAY